MWWAKTGYKIAYAGIVGVWAVLMTMVFLSLARQDEPLLLRKGGRRMDSTTILSIGIIALICVGGIWLMEH